MTRRALAVLVAVVLASGCASGGPEGGNDENRTPRADRVDPARADEPGARADMECVRGRVVAGGVDIAPRTSVRREDGESVELMGAFAGNVRLLAGTTVEACGPGRLPSGALEVTEVELLAVDGMAAVLGRLTPTAEGWYVDAFPGGERVRIDDMPTRLEGHGGEVIWIAGERTDDALAVRSYGLLTAWR